MITELFTVKKCLGVAFGVISGMSLLLNIIALISVFRLAFMLRKNQVYIIAFFNILSDVLQMTMSTFYLAPSIVLNSFLVSDKKKDETTLLFGSAFMFLWYFETITQVIMALNRFVVICLQKHNIFTFASTIFIFVLLIPFCFVMMYISQYVNPCCSFLFDQEYLSYSYYAIEGIPNYSNEFDLPLNATSSAVSALCYILIYFTVKKATPSFSSATEANKAKRNRDIKYAVQFSLILVFYICVWVLFRVLPVFLQDRHVEWFILVPAFYTINCTSNAIIYLGFNSEVQSNIRPDKIRSIFYAIGLSDVYSAHSNQIGSIASVTAFSRTSFLVAAKTVVPYFTPSRRLPPFRSIGLTSATPP